MKRNRIPPQIVRLATLTVLIVVTYFVARHFLVPKSFGKYGWFRGDALKEIAATPTTYAGQTACLDCHSEVVEKRNKSKHKSISCESCHGAQGVHAEDPSVVPAKITDLRFCIRCHEANPTRPAKFPQVNVAEHAGKQNCMECHSPHSPAEAP